MSDSRCRVSMAIGLFCAALGVANFAQAQAMLPMGGQARSYAPAMQAPWPRPDVRVVQAPPNTWPAYGYAPVHAAPPSGGMGDPPAWSMHPEALAEASYRQGAGQDTSLASLDEQLTWLESNRPRLEQLLATDVQDAPGGAYYRQYYQPLPDYVYNPAYYNTPYVGARPLADYAPPGFAPREQQEGPGVPEFLPLFPPADVTEAQRNTFVARGMYPGSFLAPGTNTSMRLRGFVRLAALYDFDPIASTDSFVTNSIPVPQEFGRNYNMSARISRFALETWTPTDFLDWNVHTFVEGDFFNGLPQAAGGGGNPFRLRHAFFDFGYFRFGQQNTVFMDGTNWPSLVDFQGPNSWVNQRQPSARITLPLSQRLYWAGSVERCFSDITTGGLGTAVHDAPDFATHVRFEGDRGHVQVSGLFRTIGYRPTGGEVTRDSASAISCSAVCHPWSLLLGTDPLRDPCASGLTRSRFLMQYTTGRGVGRYLNDLAGQGFDGQVDPITGQLELVDATGWNISYEHWFNQYWLMNYTYARISVENNVNQLPSTYDSATYQAASLWWIPVPRLSLGIEYIWGDRENLDGQSARTDRLHGLAQYNF